MTVATPTRERDARSTTPNGSVVPAYVKNARLVAWVQEMAALCKPDNVYWCDGSQQEYERMCDLLVQSGTFIKLNEAKRPNSFLARSDPSDVARVEDRTFICSISKSDAGPTNNWMAPKEMKEKLRQLFDGCMRGRTMYVMPFSHGAARLAHRADRRGTDRLAVCCGQHADHDPHGQSVLDVLGNDDFVPCMHSVGAPLEPGQQDVPWPCNKDHEVHRSLPGRTVRSGPTAAATAATRCWARSAWRCASLR